MKKAILILLFPISIFSTTIHVCIQNNVPFRTAPDFDSTEIGRIEEFDTVNVISSNGYWVQLNYKNKTGWAPKFNFSMISAIDEPEKKQTPQSKNILIDQKMVLIPRESKIYELPNDNAEIIYTTTKAETVITYTEADEWRQIMLNEKIGWVSKFKTILLTSGATNNSGEEEKSKQVHEPKEELSAHKNNDSYFLGFSNGKSYAINEYHDNYGAVSCLWGGCLGLIGSIIAYTGAENIETPDFWKQCEFHTATYCIGFKDGFREQVISRRKSKAIGNSLIGMVITSSMIYLIVSTK